MALNKVTYTDDVTVIEAQNLNDIQDEIINNTVPKDTGGEFNGTIVIDRKNGTTTSAGYSPLIIGNNIASGNDGNSAGFVRLYGETQYYCDISSATNAPTANRQLYLPNADGVLSLVSDIGFINKGHISIGGALTDIENWVKSNFVSNRWMVARVTPTSSGYFGSSSFDIMANCSSANYGWGYVHSDNPKNDGHLYFRLASGIFMWSKVVMTSLDNSWTTLLSPTAVTTQTTLSDTNKTFTPTISGFVIAFLDYTSTPPLEVAIAVKGGNNAYTIHGIASRDYDGVVVGRMYATAWCQSGVTYTILAKSYASNTNNVGAYMAFR